MLLFGYIMTNYHKSTTPNKSLQCSWINTWGQVKTVSDLAAICRNTQYLHIFFFFLVHHLKKKKMNTSPLIWIIMTLPLDALLLPHVRRWHRGAGRVPEEPRGSWPSPQPYGRPGQLLADGGGPAEPRWGLPSHFGRTSGPKSQGGHLPGRHHLFARVPARLLSRDRGRHHSPSSRRYTLQGHFECSTSYVYTLISFDALYSPDKGLVIALLPPASRHLHLSK